MNKDRSEILDKIRKLLAMAGDVGSPNEAAIAARMAAKLMREYEITHAEAIASTLSADDIDAALWGDAKRNFPAWLSSLAVHVADFTETRVRFEWAPLGGGKMLKFLGERGDIEIARYLITYLQRQVLALTKTSGVQRHIGPRTSYQRGIVAAIGQRLAEMKSEDRAAQLTTPGSGLVLVNRKLALIQEKFGVTKYKNTSHRTYSSYGDGFADGAGVALNRAINQGRGVRQLGSK